MAEDRFPNHFSATCQLCGKQLVIFHLDGVGGKVEAEQQEWYYAKGKHVDGWACPKHAPLYREVVEA